VEVDLAAHLVHVDPTEADADELREAIQQAGYTAVPVDSRGIADRPAKPGACCGCCR
jgi:copper chaperone